MSKQLKIYLLVFSILLSFAVLLHITGNNSTFRIGAAGFAVKDVTKISEISLTGNDKQVTLTRITDGWLVNNEYRADNQLMLRFLRALGNLSVKSPVPLAEQEAIMELLTESGVEVKIRKRWKAKTFKVLQLENKPTYMVLGNSKSPFLVEVPGLIGEVGELFIPDENTWRENVIFAYEVEHIAGIKLNYPSSSEKGFEIILAGDNNYELYSLTDKVNIKDYSESAVFRYLTYFSYVPYTSLLTSVLPEKADSLRNASPFANISVTDKLGKISSIQLHLIPLEGNEGFDPNVLYGLMNYGQELVQLTFVNVDLLLKELDFFLKPEKNSLTE
jgi:hypothetical protein